MKTVLKVVLALSLAGAIAGSPLLAWQEPDEKPKPEEPKKKEKPKQEPTPAPAPKQQKEEEKKQKEQTKENSKQQRRTSEQDNRAQTSVQKESGKGKKIPQEKFRTSFGREHHFHVARSGGDDRRFQYGGYVFEVVEVWPAGWSFDDDCYLEEDGDDYYVVDVMHPEVRVLVIVVSG
jgi:DNA mismatch repair ATPase MutL